VKIGISAHIATLNKIPFDKSFRRANDEFIDPPVSLLACGENGYSRKPYAVSCAPSASDRDFPSERLS